MKTIIFRLKPGADLKSSIEEVIKQNTIKAGFIVTCVGGLEQATVRMAGAKPDAQDIRTFKDDFEIVSLVGTVSTNGTHLHISFSDNEGNVHGGHLKEGTIIHPTAEIVIGINNDVEIKREMDKETGFTELVVSGPDE
ncbi:MAG TPA: PPC domain-containing DNA-binding protein [Candidatus Saccharimonadales bacterium]|nr:PPC domain-containing DNA-binding protein [Candidatus Saccharimonadales bacterium]